MPLLSLKICDGGIFVVSKTLARCTFDLHNFIPANELNFAGRMCTIGDVLMTLEKFFKSHKDQEDLGFDRGMSCRVFSSFAKRDF